MPCQRRSQATRGPVSPTTAVWAPDQVWGDGSGDAGRFPLGGGNDREVRGGNDGEVRGGNDGATVMGPRRRPFAAQRTEQPAHGVGRPLGTPALRTTLGLGPRSSLGRRKGVLGRRRGFWGDRRGCWGDRRGCWGDGRGYWGDGRECGSDGRGAGGREGRWIRGRGGPPAVLACGDATALFRRTTLRPFGSAIRSGNMALNSVRGYVLRGGGYTQ